MSHDHDEKDTKGELLPCPFCGGTPELVDSRVEWFVRCSACKPFATVIYGETVKHLDHISAESDVEADRLSEEAFAAVDWDALKASAITAWNRRADTARIVAEAVAREQKAILWVIQGLMRAMEDPQGDTAMGIGMAAGIVRDRSTQPDAGKP